MQAHVQRRLTIILLHGEIQRYVVGQKESVSVFKTRRKTGMPCMGFSKTHFSLFWNVLPLDEPSV